MQRTTLGSYRPEIDGLRFIAITVVLFFHLGFSDWSGGFTGVDIFFVLSGYLICGQIYLALLENRFSVTEFFSRRIRRLSTAAFACFFTVGVVSFFLFNPFEMDQIVRNLLGSLTFTNNILLMQEAGYFAPSAESNPFLHTWSLSIEEQFYIVLPIALVLLRYSHRKFVMLLAGAFTISLLITLFSAETLYTREARYFASILRVWELAIGGLTFVMLHTIKRPIRVVGLPVVGLIAMVFPTFAMDQGDLQPGFWALLVTMGTSLMLLTANPEQSWTGRALASKIPRYLGKISYGTYLWHWPIVVFYQYVGGDFSDKTRAIAILLSFGMGAMSHHFIEHPIRRISVTTRRGLLFALFASQSLVLVLLAGALWLRGQSADPDDHASYAQILKSSEMANDKWDQCWYANSGDRPCTFGAQVGEQTPILLWGDSMANSALPAFAELSEIQGAAGTLYTAPNCPPLAGVARSGPLAETCMQMNEAALEFLKNAPPTDVYLVARWPHYAEGVRKNRWGKSGEIGFVDSDLNEIDAETQVIFTKALTELFQAIETRHHVTLIGPAPEFPFSVPEEMIKAIRFGLPAEQLPRRRFDERSAKTARNLQKVTAENDAEYLDISAVFCDQDICFKDVDGIPLFSDHVHFSVKGNKLLLGLLTNQIQ